MKCDDCGKELIEVRKLTDEEMTDYNYIVMKHDTVNSMFTSTDVSGYTDEQALEFYKTVADAEVQANYADFLFCKTIREEIGPFHSIVDGVIYKHPEE